MKKNIYGLVFIITILSACSQSRNIGSSSYNDDQQNNSYSYDQSNSITYDQFYEDLSPYGRWIDNPEFGRVWSPRQAGFQPYQTDGHWAYTNYGWTWVSDYNWGWAPFHYGRWFYDNFEGWMWVPGYEWAPAWVNWRRSSDYYGWAPLCPQRRNGSYYEIQNDQWSFVPSQYIYRDDLNNYYVNRQNNITIINNTTVINNPRVINNGPQYQQGPNVAEVEKVTKAKIRTFPVRQTTVPGDTKLKDGVLHIYKPVVKQNNSNTINSNGISPSLDQSQKVRTLQKRNVFNKNADRSSVKNQVNTNTDANNLRVNSIPANVDGQQNSPALNNGDLNTPAKRRRQLRDYQQPADISNQQTPETRPTINQRRRVIQNSDLNNDMAPRQVQPEPAQNTENRIYRQQRVREFQQQNNQQSNPDINQRPSRTPQNSTLERPANTMETRPQPAPQSAPDNSNRTNVGRKFRSF